MLDLMLLNVYFVCNVSHFECLPKVSAKCESPRGWCLHTKQALICLNCTKCYNDWHEYVVSLLDIVGLEF